MENEQQRRQQQQDEYVLGIDVGSTSIKATVVRRRDGQPVADQRISCVETYGALDDAARSEQNVARVTQLLDRCVRSLPAQFTSRVVGVGVCGQMHGVVCWSSEERPWRWSDDSGVKRCDRDCDCDYAAVTVDADKVSPHYTWQDGRCTPQFLASLPTPSHSPVHTGYGCSTLFWLAANSADALGKFDRAGTLADFVVTMLCDLRTPQMSPQNAASWGYFDAERGRFDERLLRDAGFPVRLLPRVRPDNGAAGTLKHAWHGIPAGTLVGVAFGDLQAYVLAVSPGENAAVVNVSTSAQIVLVDRRSPPSAVERTAAVVVPYFEGKYLYQGAALNGGNAISLFVDYVTETLRLFDCRVARDRIWRRLIEESAKTGHDTAAPANFAPTFRGERHCPLQRATIDSLTADNFNSAALFRALCKGIVCNLHELVPEQVLRQKGVVKILGTGTALLRNETLRLELQNRYASFPVEYAQSSAADSAIGAALAVSKLLQTATR